MVQWPYTEYMNAENLTPKRQRGRSPGYPAISLEKAIQRVGQLYRADKQYPIPATTVPTIWGYASLNGPASLAVSALKKFGLVDDEGAKEERTLKVTDLAIRILNHPSSDAKLAAIKEAALMPPIHLEMWERYGRHLPSDENLAWRLTREKGFTDTGAREFIREWRETVEFANFDEQDASDAHNEGAEPELPPPTPAILSPDSKSPGIGNESLEPGAALPAPMKPVASVDMGPIVGRSTIPNASVETGSALQHFPIPIALQGRPAVTISGPFPLSEDEWLQFRAVLEAMRPVLVTPAETE